MSIFNQTFVDDGAGNDVFKSVFDAIVLSEVTYYVATNGSDSNNGSELSPFATLSHALDEAKAVSAASVAILMADGFYFDPHIDLTSSSKPIVISKSGSGTVTITATKEIPDVSWAELTALSGNVVTDESGSDTNTYDLLSVAQQGNIYRCGINSLVDSAQDDGYKWDEYLIPARLPRNRTAEVFEFGNTGIECYQESSGEMARYKLSRWPTFTYASRRSSWFTNSSDVADRNQTGNEGGTNANKIRIDAVVPQAKIDSWADFPTSDENRIFVQGLRRYSSCTRGTALDSSISGATYSTIIDTASKAMILDNNILSIDFNEERGLADTVMRDGAKTAEWDDPHTSTTVTVQAASSSGGNDLPTGFAVWNALSELKQGEMWLDRKAGVLYVWPNDTNDLTGFRLSTEWRPMIDLEGCSNITFNGIRFDGSRRGMVKLKDCSGISFVRCTFKHNMGRCGSIRSCENIAFHHCYIGQQGAGGFFIWDELPSDLTARDSILFNRCAFDGLSEYCPTGSTAVQYTHSRGVTVNRCTFRNISHNVLSTGGLAPHEGPNAAHNLSIRGNYFDHCCNQTWDAGVIYTAWRIQTATPVNIDGNYIARYGNDSEPMFSYTIGIYNDDGGTLANTIQNNVIETDGDGLYGFGIANNRSPRNLIVKNNTFIGHQQMRSEGTNFNDGQQSPGNDSFEEIVFADMWAQYNSAYRDVANWSTKGEHIKDQSDWQAAYPAYCEYLSDSYWPPLTGENSAMAGDALQNEYLREMGEEAADPGVWIEHTLSRLDGHEVGFWKLSDSETPHEPGHGMEYRTSVTSGPNIKWVKSSHVMDEGQTATGAFTNWKLTSDAAAPDFIDLVVSLDRTGDSITVTANSPSGSTVMTGTATAGSGDLTEVTLTSAGTINGYSYTGTVEVDSDCIQTSNNHDALIRVWKSGSEDVSDSFALTNDATISFVDFCPEYATLVVTKSITGSSCHQVAIRSDTLDPVDGKSNSTDFDITGWDGLTSISSIVPAGYSVVHGDDSITLTAGEIDDMQDLYDNGSSETLRAQGNFNGFNGSVRTGTPTVRDDADDRVRIHDIENFAYGKYRNANRETRNSEITGNVMVDCVSVALIDADGYFFHDAVDAVDLSQADYEEVMSDWVSEYQWVSDQANVQYTTIANNKYYNNVGDPVDENTVDPYPLGLDIADISWAGHDGSITIDQSLVGITAEDSTWLAANDTITLDHPWLDEEQQPVDATELRSWYLRKYTLGGDLPVVFQMTGDAVEASGYQYTPGRRNFEYTPVARNFEYTSGSRRYQYTLEDR